MTATPPVEAPADESTSTSKLPSKRTSPRTTTELDSSRISTGTVISEASGALASAAASAGDEIVRPASQPSPAAITAVMTTETRTHRRRRGASGTSGPLRQYGLRRDEVLLDERLLVLVEDLAGIGQGH